MNRREAIRAGKVPTKKKEPRHTEESFRPQTHFFWILPVAVLIAFISWIYRPSRYDTRMWRVTNIDPQEWQEASLDTIMAQTLHGPVILSRFASWAKDLTNWNATRLLETCGADTEVPYLRIKHNDTVAKSIEGRISTWRVNTKTRFIEHRAPLDVFLGRNSSDEIVFAQLDRVCPSLLGEKSIS